MTARGQRRVRLLACALGPLALVGADVPGAFDDVDPAPSPRIVISKDGEAAVIDARLSVSYGPGAVWQVVLDYDGLADYMPNVDSSAVIARENGRVRVRQVGGVRFIFRRTYRFELEFTRLDASRVAFRQVAGDLLGYEGEWRVEPEGPSRSTIVYHGRLAHGLGAPWALAQPLLYRNLRKMLAAIRIELEGRDDR